MGEVQLCLKTLDSGRLDPHLAFEDILIIIDGEQIIAGGGGQPNVNVLVLQHLVVDSLLLPALTLHPAVQLDLDELDDAHLFMDLVLLILPVQKMPKINQKESQVFLLTLI